MIIVQNPPKIINSAVKQTDHEKPTYHEAITGPHKDRWVMAMYEELKSIQQNQTWQLVALPPDGRAIGVKWVLTCKYDAKSNFTKHKARLVAKGDSQEFGFDYDETYVPIVHIEHICILFALAAFFGLLLIHLDVKNAFLHGESGFVIYIHQPPSFKN